LCGFVLGNSDFCEGAKKTYHFSLAERHKYMITSSQ